MESVDSGLVRGEDARNVDVEVGLAERQRVGRQLSNLLNTDQDHGLAVVAD